MQDIDFDEIDRAVNSVTSSNTNETANANPVPVPGEAPVAPESVVEPVVEPEALVATTPSPAARRSSGRFMDVVHPSSDMRPEIPPRSTTPTLSVGRDEVAEREEPESQTAAPQSTAFHWPDPIDMPEPAAVTPVEQMQEDIQPSTSDVPPEVIEEPPVIIEPDDEKNDLDAASLESPFLMDAKVEKRPLGAFSGADAGLPLLEDPIPSVVDTTTTDDEKPEVEEPSHEEHEEVPHELHETLLALDGHNQDNVQEDLAPEPLERSEPAPVIDDIPSGPTSITQQYTEQPVTGNEVSGSIFDTEAYHTPLTHPPKKRSPVLVIVWIIALILVGGGIGAGIYYVVLPMLG